MKKICLFDKECTTPKASEAIRLYAEYVEGSIESSKEKYNKLMHKATVKDVLYIIFHTPFERQAIRLYDVLLKAVGDETRIPIEVVEKVKQNRIFVQKIDASIATTNSQLD